MRAPRLVLVHSSVRCLNHVQEVPSIGRNLGNPDAQADRYRQCQLAGYPIDRFEAIEKTPDIVIRIFTAINDSATPVTPAARSFRRCDTER